MSIPTIRAQGRVCLACQQGLDMPVALPIAAATFTAADLHTFNQASAWDDDDRADMFQILVIVGRVVPHVFRGTYRDQRCTKKFLFTCSFGLDTADERRLLDQRSNMVR
ncbi:MAG: hypothetical protein U0X93_12635 [Anaerolineales bacterium]